MRAQTVRELSKRPKILSES
ncbi:unnamed protein product [Medioppia subpectinata]|uniref:Uncharacterized protein n=1 Tax=Medioppia subpectinata TaxID=1979941 RepID=A0A7R9LG89_9ACAR|nr:unnamed protein product [Medioppia subpectinata]CAG2118512.1 unnamed protein product [Medioppia subpectinata]